MAGTVMDVHEYGTREEYATRVNGTWVYHGTRVQCVYCHKRLPNFYRLKFHLGNVRKDVAPCYLVPDTVREAFYKMVMEQYVYKRGRSQGSSSETVAPENGNIAVEADDNQDTQMCVAPENGNIAVEADDNQDTQMRVAPENGNIAVEANDNQDTRMCVARFFYEHCVDFSAADSTSFKQMMMTASGGQMGLNIPHSRDLNGCMLQEVLNEVVESVKKIKDSWAIRGCSILLDAWVDQKGHNLVSFVADCPAGAVYLKSLDISDVKDDATALTTLVNGVVEEVGKCNVIQIIACSTSGWVGDLGKLFSGEVFWSVSFSHFVELMLVKIGIMQSFGDIHDKVNTIWEFISNNPSLLKLFRGDSHREDVTLSSSEFEFVTPYLTLESIFKGKIVAVFESPDWKKEEDITVSSLVNDSSFWETVERVVKCTSPLIHGLLLLSTVHNKHVGYVYNILVIIKENIAWNFNYQKQLYKPLLDVIDDVWNNHIRNPLHAAGYILNPKAYYSDRFHLDQEGFTDLTSSLVHVVKEASLQVKIATQIDMYRLGEDCYKEASQADQVSGISAVEWWNQKASQHPELQSFAIKILSQTCEGASRYKLKRNLAEKLLLTEGMTHCEKQHLEELAFVHYNLHLQSCKSKVTEKKRRDLVHM